MQTKYCQAFSTKFCIYCGLWLISIQAFQVINLALWLIFQFGHTHWLKSRKICQSTKICWLTKNQLKKLSSVKNIWQMSSCFRVSGTLGEFGKTGPKYSTPNGLRYIVSKTKSSTPHLAPNEVFRLIFIEAFQAIDLIFAILKNFNFRHAHWWKNREI